MIVEDYPNTQLILSIFQLQITIAMWCLTEMINSYYASPITPLYEINPSAGQLQKSP